MSRPGPRSTARSCSTSPDRPPHGTLCIVDVPGLETGGAVMNVVVTGGSGFLGSRLARTLLAAGSLDVAGAGARPLARVTLVDQAPVPADLAADDRVAGVRGELGELLDPDRAGPDTLAGADVIFHLAAAVSWECEADFDLGMRTN